MYKVISKYYNKIFPLKREKIDFVINLMKTKDDKILDIGCATGELTIHLNKLGYDTIGIDIDEEMISYARKCANSLGIEASFINGDMLRLNEYFHMYKFDVAICWGNTIAHLNDLNKIKEFISGCYDILNPEGCLSLQVINFSKVIKKDSFSLPEINNDYIKFKRNYFFNSERKLVFQTEVTIKETGEFFRFETLHFPILKDELLSILSEEGFNSFKLFSDFNYKLFEENDTSIIVNCIKI